MSEFSLEIIIRQAERNRTINSIIEIIHKTVTDETEQAFKQLEKEILLLKK
jgi:hypothetical protein